MKKSPFTQLVASVIAALALAVPASADIVLYESMTVSGSSASDGVHILTDIVPVSNTVVRAKYASKQNHNGCLFCARKSSYNTPPYFVFLPTVSRKFEFDYGDQNYKATANFVTDRVYEVEVRNGIATVTDTVSGDTVSLGSGALAALEPNRRLALFETYGSTSYGTWGNAFEGVFHYLKTYDIENGEEVLKHCLVPCKDGNEVKLCDLADGNKTYALTFEGDGAVSLNGTPSLAVEAGESLRLTAGCTVGDLSGAAGATLVADGCEVAIAGGNHYLGGLELATENGGSFVKTGAGTAYLYAPGALGTTLHVADGGVVFSEYGLTQKYWRWTFSKVSQSPNPLWLGRLWLFGTDGSHVAADLIKTSEDNVSLSAGRVTWKYDASVTNIALHAEGVGTAHSVQYLNRVFWDNLSDNINTFPMLGSPVIDPANADSWLGVEFRMKSDDAPVTGYNIMAAVRTSGDFASVLDHIPVSWMVEASDDGVAWTEIEARADVDTSKVTERGRFYDGESYTVAALRGSPVEHFKLGGYKRSGLTADATKALSVQVDGGASLDLTAFTSAPQKIGGITVDFAKGGGTVVGGSLASSGTLAIVSAAQGYSAGSPLPLTLDGVANASNIAGWTVTVDGAAAQSTVRIRDGHIIVGELPTVLSMR